MIRSLLQSAFGVFLLAFSLPKVITERQEMNRVINIDQEVAYLPSTDSIHLLSFGFNNALSHLLWFKTTSYFGKHHATDQNFKWLGHMCSLVIELNPKAQYVAEFCSNMLSWEVGQPKLSIELLSKAIEVQPNNWRLRYLRGFQQMFFLHDNIAAQADLVAAAELPGAEPFVARLAAGMLAKGNDLDTAIEFLAELTSRAKDDNERKTLQQKLNEAIHERSLRNLEEAIKFFVSKYSRNPNNIDELVEQKIILGSLRDPWGGSYTYDASSNQVTSTSNKKRNMRAKLTSEKNTK